MMNQTFLTDVEVLGAETIRVWRWFRLRRWLRRWWLRVTWKPVVAKHILLRVDAGRGSLQSQCRGSLPCVTCGSAIRLPAIPDGTYTATTFGCARCHSYFYVDTAPNLARYDTIRRQLAEKAQA
jgi:hypothetical protein